jgi:hypothetical protein
MLFCPQDVLDLGRYGRSTSFPQHMQLRKQPSFWENVSFARKVNIPAVARKRSPIPYRLGDLP